MTITSASSGYDGGHGYGTSSGDGRKLVLVIEDSLSQATAYSAYLTAAGYDVEHVQNGEAALSMLAASSPDIVVLDLFLPGIQGVDVLRYMRKNGFNQPVIVITDYASVDTAVGAMRDGAYDFVAKPFGAERLRVTVDHALLQMDLENEVRSYKENYERERFHGFVGSSKPMQAVYRIVESAAVSRATIFITGESGTGKELCAQALHLESPRAEGPFVAINCAAIPRSLMESEIFGHVKGSFTGADAARDGAAVEADGGTLFLDEICDMDLDLQAKLLRFVQTGTFRPVGSSEEKKVDVRFVCATNRDPLEEVAAGRFREDLYYRLHVVPIALPALRERPGDIPSVARYFLNKMSVEEGKRFSGFSVDAEELLKSYEWPGNVRQIENIMRSIVVLYDAETVTADMIPAPVNRTGAAVVGNGRPDLSGVAGVDRPNVRGPRDIRALADIEKEAIESAIEACAGNVSKAAALLGVSPSTVYRKRQTWYDE